MLGFDILWLGNLLKPHPGLQVAKANLRNIDEVPPDGVRAIIHVSSVVDDLARIWIPS